MDKLNRASVPFFLLALTAIAITVATFVEAVQGTSFVHEYFYGHWWFVALWALLAIASVEYMVRVRLWHRPAVGLLHLSFLVILLGALVTFVTGRNGMLHVRLDEGVVSQTIDLPFKVALSDFDIEYYEDSISPRDYISHLRVARLVPEADSDSTMLVRYATYRCSMNSPATIDNYRFYQTSYDLDGCGSVLDVNYDPYGTAITYLGYLLLAVSLMWLSGRRLVLLAPIGLLLAGATQLLYYQQPSVMGYEGGLLPVLRSPLLGMHVSIIIVAYVLFVVLTVRGIIGLVRPVKGEQYLPFNRKLLFSAVCCLTVGIFLGAVWANLSWGRYWGWDPKESWALVTMIIYALPLHHKSLAWFRSSRHFDLYMILAILAVLMTFFGVNYFLAGMHSYA